MNSPKPQPPKKNMTPAEPTPQESKPSTKRPFVRSAHLTSKPFQDSMELRALQSQLNRRDNKKINPKAKRQR